MDFEYPKEYEFFNVKTGEKRILKAQGTYAKHMINGFILASNLSRNSTRGQDFGWRLARPTLEIVKKAQGNPMIMREIATAKGVNPRGVRLPDLIEFLVDSYNANLQAEEIANEEEPRFQAEYEASLKGIEAAPVRNDSDLITDDILAASDTTVINNNGELTVPKTDGKTTIAKKPEQKAKA